MDNQEVTLTDSHLWTAKQAYNLSGGATVAPSRSHGDDGVYVTFYTPKGAYCRLDMRARQDAVAFAKAILAACGES